MKASTAPFLIFISLLYSTLSYSVQLNDAKGLPPNKEAKVVRQACLDNPSFIGKYDCDCIGVEYQKERIKQGSKPDATNILVTIRNRCKSERNYSTMVRNLCLNGPMGRNLKRKGVDVQSYCACYGKEMGRMYIQKEWSNAIASMSNYKARAACDRMK